MITAPYNFVPLNKEVFCPSWSDDVNHDVPFEDGESGEIEISITTKSPTFIRDSTNKEEFCQHNGEYYIPSTSIKGMIRNVFEIMTFSKMSFIDDTTYSIRDLKYKKYMDKIRQGVSCGWLYMEDEILKIEDCGEPYRIKYDEIDKKFNINFKQNFMKGTFDNAKSPYKKASEKYKLFKEDIFNTVYNFSSPQSDTAGRKIVQFNDIGEVKGKIVLTGHPSPRNESVPKPSGKIYDFIFPLQEKANVYNVEKKVYDNFKFAYFDGRKNQPLESEDWTFWKKRLKTEGTKIPIFFHKDFSGVSSFGLSYLYKFPYENSVMDTLFDSHLSDDMDLSQTVFGFSEKIENEQISLKGRVNFSHGVKKENSVITPLSSRYILLGSPKASYYPIYLVQNGDEYKTLMDSNAILAGWKRYPIHKNFNHKCAGESKQTSLIKPLKESSEFKTKIRIHNLKPLEIGALLSSLLFHGNDKCFHSLGMGKPYGYGKVKLNINNFSGFKYSKNEYMKLFEAAMNSEIFDNEIKWHESEQIKNLFSMASEQNDSNLEYMELPDFAKNKNKDDDNSYNFLNRYVDLEKVNILKAQNFASIEDISFYQKYIEVDKKRQAYKKEEKEKEKKEKEEKKKKKEQQKRDWENAKISNSIEGFNNFINKYPDSLNEIEQAKKLIEQIKQNQEEQKKKDLQNEANEKWEAVQKVDTKIKQKALENFISNYAHSQYIDSAKKELESFTSSTNAKSSSTVVELRSAKDGKRVKAILEKLANIDDAMKIEISNIIVEIYPTFKSKDQKNFFKDAQLARFLGSDIEEKIKNQLK